MGIYQTEGDNRYTENLENWIKEEYGNEVVAWENVPTADESDPDSSVLYLAIKDTEPTTPGFPHQGHIRAIVVLHRGGKEIGEEAGPIASTCPPSILTLLTPTDNTLALQWRERCWQNNWTNTAIQITVSQN